MLIQLTMESTGSVFLKLYCYATDPWNILDMVSFLSYAAGLILRFIPISVCSTCFYASRIIFALNYMAFFFHIFIVFAVHPALGPKLVIIARMVRYIIHTRLRTSSCTSPVSIVLCMAFACCCITHYIL